MWSQNMSVNAAMISRMTILEDEVSLQEWRRNGWKLALAVMVAGRGVLQSCQAQSRRTAKYIQLRGLEFPFLVTVSAPPFCGTYSGTDCGTLLWQFPFVVTRFAAHTNQIG
jgi:hypothetical protein